MPSSSFEERKKGECFPPTVKAVWRKEFPYSKRIAQLKRGLNLFWLKWKVRNKWTLTSARKFYKLSVLRTVLWRNIARRNFSPFFMMSYLFNFFCVSNQRWKLSVVKFLQIFYKYFLNISIYGHYSRKHDNFICIRNTEKKFTVCFASCFDR